MRGRATDDASTASHPGRPHGGLWRSSRRHGAASGPAEHDRQRRWRHHPGRGVGWDAPFFTSQLARPLVVTVANAPPDQLAKAAAVADVVIAGDYDVDLATALAALGSRGFQAVLAEGGPTLNGQLAAAGLLDELCLTLSPRLAGGNAKRILDGTSLGATAGLRLCSVCEQDGFLFLRYRSS